MKLSQMIVTFALILVSSVAFGQTAATAPAATGVSATLIAQEKVLLESVVKHDVKAFSALIAPGAGSVDEGGYMAVAEFIKMFDQAKIDVQTPTDIKVLSLGPTAAVVTYTLNQKGTFRDSCAANRVATTTWVNRGGSGGDVPPGIHRREEATPPRALDTLRRLRVRS
jgi:hypothetical protein